MSIDPASLEFASRTLDLAVISSRANPAKKQPATAALFVCVPSYSSLDAASGYQEKVLSVFETLGAYRLWKWSVEGHDHHLLVIDSPGAFRDIATKILDSYEAAMASITGAERAAAWKGQLVSALPEKDIPDRLDMINWTTKAFLPLAAPFIDPFRNDGPSVRHTREELYDELYKLAFSGERFVISAMKWRDLQILNATAFVTPIGIVGYRPEMAMKTAKDGTPTITITIPWQYMRRGFTAAHRITSSLVKHKVLSARVTTTFVVNRTGRDGRMLRPDPHGMEQMYVHRVEIDPRSIPLEKAFRGIRKAVHGVYPNLRSAVIDDRAKPSYAPLPDEEPSPDSVKAGTVFLPNPYAERRKLAKETAQARETKNCILVYTYNPEDPGQSKNAVRVVFLPDERESVEPILHEFSSDRGLYMHYSCGKRFGSAFFKGTKEMAGLEYRIRIARELKNLLGDDFELEAPRVRIETYEHRKRDSEEIDIFFKVPCVLAGSVENDYIAGKLDDKDLSRESQAILCLTDRLAEGRRSRWKAASAQKEEYTATFAYRAADKADYEKGLESLETAFQETRNAFPDVDLSIHRVDKNMQRLAEEEKGIDDVVRRWEDSSSSASGQNPRADAPPVPPNDMDLESANPER